MNLPNLDSEAINRILEMAWEDRTSFEAIKLQFGLPEKQVIASKLQRFTADASHELRTPIATVLSNAEVTLMPPEELSQ